MMSQSQNSVDYLDVQNNLENKKEVLMESDQKLKGSKNSRDDSNYYDVFDVVTIYNGTFVSPLIKFVKKNLHDLFKSIELSHRSSMGRNRYSIKAINHLISEDAKVDCIKYITDYDGNDYTEYVPSNWASNECRVGYLDISTNKEGDNTTPIDGANSLSAKKPSSVLSGESEDNKHDPSIDNEGYTLLNEWVEMPIKNTNCGNVGSNKPHDWKRITADIERRARSNEIKLYTRSANRYREIVDENPYRTEELYF